MNNIKGRHWVFIVGLLLACITSIWSPSVAESIIFLLGLIGVGIYFRD